MSGVNGNLSGAERQIVSLRRLLRLDSDGGARNEFDGDEREGSGARLQALGGRVGEAGAQRRWC